MDRRSLALLASAGLWGVSVLLAVQALLGVESVWLLYGLIALQSAFYALNNPARGAIVPRLLDKHLLPAAGALNMAAFNLGFTVGPDRRCAGHPVARVRRGVPHRRPDVLRRLLRAATGCRGCRPRAR